MSSPFLQNFFFSPFCAKGLPPPPRKVGRIGKGPRPVQDRSVYSATQIMLRFSAQKSVAVIPRSPYSPPCRASQWQFMLRASARGSLNAWMLEADRQRRPGRIGYGQKYISELRGFSCLYRTRIGPILPPASWQRQKAVSFFFLIFFIFLLDKYVISCYNPYQSDRKYMNQK